MALPSEMLAACASSHRDLRCGLDSSLATAIIFETVFIQVSLKNAIKLSPNLHISY